MRRGWESEALNWARFTRTPGHEHRPLEAYSQALEAAGMRIDAIREVGSPSELVARNPPSTGGGEFRSSSTSVPSGRAGAEPVDR
jgi:hypothetical protein